MAKSCVRFRAADDLALDIVAEALRNQEPWGTCSTAIGGRRDSLFFRAIFDLGSVAPTAIIHANVNRRAMGRRKTPRCRESVVGSRLLPQKVPARWPHRVGETH